MRPAGIPELSGILPCQIFVFLWVFHKRAITPLHVKKMAKLRCGGRGRGHPHVKKMDKLRRGGRGRGHLQFFCVPPPRNYSLKCYRVLSPPTMKWDLRPWEGGTDRWRKRGRVW